MQKELKGQKRHVVEDASKVKEETELEKPEEGEGKGTKRTG